jgi:hypothetical protein
MQVGYAEYAIDVVRVGQGARPREREVAHEAHAFGVDGSGTCGAELPNGRARWRVVTEQRSRI